MDLFPGDRVISVHGDYPGLAAREYGTVVSREPNGYLNVRWDEYSEHRHDGNGDVERGHGWFVTDYYVELCPPDDLGELPSVECADAINDILFGGYE